MDRVYPLLLLWSCACSTATSSPGSPEPAPVLAPHAELDAMDPRKPVPLQPMMAHHQKQQMRSHLEAIEAVVGALGEEDWAAVEAAAERIGSSPQMQMTCEHMGAGAEGFTEQALEFHRRADAIGEGARQKDALAVLKATSSTLQVCTSCHRTWKQDVVSSAEWSARTGGQALDH